MSSDPELRALRRLVYLTAFLAAVVLLIFAVLIGRPETVTCTTTPTHTLTCSSSRERP